MSEPLRQGRLGDHRVHNNHLSNGHVESDHDHPRAKLLQKTIEITGLTTITKGWLANEGIKKITALITTFILYSTEKKPIHCKNICTRLATHWQVT